MGLPGKSFRTVQCGAPGPIVGTFLVGERLVGERQYYDATCGLAGNSGEAICGAWWAYPCPDGLGLGAFPAEVFIGSADEIPAAGLGLGGLDPTLRIHYTTPPAEVPGFGLGTLVPEMRITSILTPDPAGLALGAEIPDYAGIRYYLPVTCVEVDLDPVACQDQVLEPVGCTSVALDEVEVFG